MCKPFEGYDDPIRGAANEVVSGQSALNMEPRPKKNQTEDEKERGWLPDVDEMVDHAMEHFHAAFKLLIGQRCERDVYREVYHRLAVLRPDSKKFEEWLLERCKYED